MTVGDAAGVVAEALVKEAPERAIVADGGKVSLPETSELCLAHVVEIERRRSA